MGVLEAVRRPAYTGPNRCWPCTVLNAGLVAAAATVAGLVWLPAALVVAAAGTLALWLRGYVVPFTPRFAPAVAERLPVSFKPETPDGTGSLSGGDDPDPERILATLLEAEVLESADERLFLADWFADAWDRECKRLRTATDEELAAAVDAAAPGDPSISVTGGWVTVAGTDRVVLSKPVAVADVAAVRALEDADAGLDEGARATAAYALRAFRETCPVCGVDLEESSTADCCGGTRSAPRPALACPDCDRLLHVFPEESA